MADLEQLKAKYVPVIQTIEQFSAEGAKVEDVSLDGDKLLLKATVPSQVVANQVWDAIKQVDPRTPICATRLHLPAAGTRRTPSGPGTIFPRSASCSTVRPTIIRRSRAPMVSAIRTRFRRASRSRYR